ncbi:MAG: BACON domain-containing protein [Bacteroidales bacterium]|nr:BACON domain-containing protein [Bacteroidales bacterium]
MKAELCILVLLVLFSFSGCRKGTKSQFPDLPPNNVTSLMDRDQMLSQLGIVMPELPPKLEDPNAPENTFPANPANPEGNWTDSLRNPDAPVSRSIFGLWNNYSDKSDGFYPGPDSARLGHYTPIDLLKMKNGKVITTTEEWWSKRRPEIVKDIEDQLYGRIPDEKILPKVTWSVTTSSGGSGNSAYIQKQIIGTIDVSRYPQVRNKPEIRATLRTPAKATGPVPVILFFGGFGNVNEFYWERSNPHGWGTCVFDLTALQPDNGVGLTSYLIGLVNQGKWRKPTDWGSLVAWSWGVSRLMDYFENDKDVNAEMIGLNGVSRYGKATIVAMACEPRIAIGFPGDAGSLGTKMNRRHWGQDLENSCDANEYHWMAGNFFRWAGELVPGQYLPRKIEECPADAHSLLALCAPRPVFMNGGSTSAWCDPYGVYLSGKYASPVYELFGVKGLVMNDRKPEFDKAYIDGTIGYRCHTGGHSDAPNWPAFFEFAARHLDITILSASVSTITISSKAGSSATFTISSNKDWVIICPEEWLKVDAGSSSGTGSVTLTPEANTENSGRSAVLSIKTKGREQTVTVHQASSRPELDVMAEEFKGVRSKELIVGGSANSQASFDIKSNTAWSISVSYAPQEGEGARFRMGSGNWITLSDDAGINSKTILLSAANNPQVRKRSAVLTVSTQGIQPITIKVTQEEGAPTLDVMADTLTFNAKGGNASPLFVMTNTTWNLKCSDQWISATPETGGNFSQVVISARENTGSSDRKGEVIMTVQGLPPKIIVITQDAALEN